MAKLLKLRRGTTTQHGSFTGAEGELTIDTTKDTAVVHDGSQAGGRPLLREDMANLPAGTIDNADVNASAAIAGTKIAPDFGSQTITTTGRVLFANVYTNESDLPNASTYHGMFAHVHSTGLAYFAHAGAWIKLAPLNAPDFTGGIDVTGNITATGTVDGRDVAADGTKLDTVETNAKDDQTASEILTLIKTVDGVGSGLNADDLDGLAANSFLRSDAADSAANAITFNYGGGAATIGTGSDIRLLNGTWTGDYGAKIQHHDNYLFMQGGSNGHILRNSSGTNNLVLDNSGNAVFVGNVTAYSDERLKTDISTINDALGICGKLRGVSYKWIATDQPSIGVIAQEVEEVLPEVVLNNRDTNPSTGETTEIKSVDYGKIVGVLINAINELKAEVDELKKPKKKGGK